MTGLEERPTMGNGMSGGTMQLLRTARSRCESALSFVALAGEGEQFTVATYPEDPEEGSLGTGVVLDIVRQLWLDPGIARRKVLLRTVRLTPGEHDVPARGLSVAVVPVGADGAGRPTGLVGVVDPDAKTFGISGPGVLYPLARRYSSYLAARQHLRDRIACTAPTMELPPVQAAVPTEDARAGLLDVERLLFDEDSVHGLLSLGALLARTGRLLGAAGEASGALAVMALEVAGAPVVDADVVAVAARGIRMVLRFDDPVCRLGSTVFVAVVPLTPGGTGADATAARLTESVRAAVAGSGAVVRSAHVVADLATAVDVEELVRGAVRKLRAQ